MTVRELLKRIDSEELTEWMAFDRIEPIGSGRTNLAVAGLAALTANLNRDRGKHPEPYQPAAFLDYYLPYTDPAERAAAKKSIHAGRRLMNFLRGR